MSRKAAFALFAILTCGAWAPCLGQDEVKSPTRSNLYQHAEFTTQAGDKLDYWLLKPETIEPDKKYPLVLALHGRGGNTEAAGVLASPEMRKKHPCFVLAPAVSRAGVWAVPADFEKLRGAQRLPDVLEALQSLVKQHPIDPSRVYVTGQSMGGVGSFAAVASSPQTFAAAIPVCGAWDPKDAEKMKGVPLWAFHGDADPTVPVERSRQMVEALKKAGGAPRFTEYPGVGHDSWSKAYASPETWEWLFAQKRANP